MLSNAMPAQRNFRVEMFDSTQECHLLAEVVKHGFYSTSGTLQSEAILTNVVVCD